MFICIKSPHQLYATQAKCVHLNADILFDKSPSLFTECLFSADTDEEMPENYETEEYHKVRSKMSKCL